MRYRVDLVLNANQSINVFRQTLTNNSDVAVTISLTNITRNELIRNIDFLINNSERLIAEGVMPEGANGVVVFKVYDNPKRIGGRRNITFSSSINKDDYICKFIDSAESNEKESCFLNRKYDVSMYLRYAGNPELVLAQETKESKLKEVKLESSLTTEEGETVFTNEVVAEEEAPVKEIIIEEEQTVKTYTKSEDGKFYCPFEDCEKHKEGYATEKGIKAHMLKVHKVEC